MPEVKLSNASLEALFSKGLAALIPEDEIFLQERDAYRQAASVLFSFDPERLHPYGIDSYEEKAALRYLMEDCRVVSTEDYQEIRWCLDTDLRRESLKKLVAGKKIKNALKVNKHESRRKNLSQLIFENYLTGPPPELDPMNVEQLQAALIVVQWLEGIISPLPATDEIKNRINTLKFFERFRKLIAGGFVGREEELKKLTEHTTVGKTTQTEKKDASVDNASVPLALYGPGGVGKTSLMAKFILESTEDGKSLNFPLIYYDFDDAALGSSLSSPLLTELLRLLSLQYPDYSAMIEKFRQRTSIFFKGEAEALRVGESATSISYVRIDPQLLDRLEHFFIRNVGNLITRIFRKVYGEEPATSARPVLLILDTFENVQHTSEGKVRQIWKYIDLLGKQLSNLRVIIAGRDAIDTEDLPGMLPESLVLGNLDKKASVGILKKYGIHDTRKCDEIYELTDGNPLSLRLAATATSRGIMDISMVKNAVDPGESVPGLSDDNLMQGQLYERLLIHIDDESVRRLANPGLALRVISPQIILDVLRGPCRLEIETIEEAKNLMEKLEKASLVVKEGDTLRHRSDVRRIMLKLIDRAEPGLVRRINLGAVNFYEKEYEKDKELKFRAEEIYHRLRLSQEASVINARWLRGIEDRLQGALDELPVSSQVFLAERLGLELKKEIREILLITDWEKITALKARDFMKHGEVKAAERLLMKRRERSSNSPLYLIEAEIAVFNQQWNEAREKIKLAESAAISTGDTAMQLSAIYLEASVAFQLKDYGLTERLARRAELLADEINEPQTQLRASVLRYKALKLLGQNTKIATVQDNIAKSFTKILNTETITDKALLRDIAIAMAGNKSELFNKAFYASGFGNVRFGPFLRTLASLFAWLKRPENQGLVSGFDLQINLLLSNNSINKINQQIWKITGSTLTKQVLQLLESMLAERPDDPDLQKVIATALEESTINTK